jgi:hypothetical protein
MWAKLVMHPPQGAGAPVERCTALRGPRVQTMLSEYMGIECTGERATLVDVLFELQDEYAR